MNDSYYRWAEDLHPIPGDSTGLLANEECDGCPCNEAYGLVAATCTTHGTAGERCLTYGCSCWVLSDGECEGCWRNKEYDNEL